MSGGCGSWSILEELLANEMLLKVWLQQTHRLELLGRKSWELLVTGGILGVFSFQVSAGFSFRCYTEWGLVNLLTGAEDDSDCLRTELGLVGSGPTSTNLLTGHYWARHHNKLSNTTPVTPHTLSSLSVSGIGRFSPQQRRGGREGNKYTIHPARMMGLFPHIFYCYKGLISVFFCDILLSTLTL